MKSSVAFILSVFLSIAVNNTLGHVICLDCLPPSYSLRTEIEDYGLRVIDQGSRETCGISSMVGALEYAYAKIGSFEVLSIEYLNWAANEAMGRTGDGALLSEIVRGIRKWGISSSTLMPYNSVTYNPIIPTPAAKQEAASRQYLDIAIIKNWDNKAGIDWENVQRMKALLYCGYPLVAGFMWPNQNHKTLIDVPDPSYVYDGHAVLLVEYNDDETYPGGGYFVFRNSRGTTYHDQGFSKVSYDYVQMYMNDAVAVHVNPDQCMPYTFINTDYLSQLESLSVAQKSSGLWHTVQDMSTFRYGNWVEDMHLFIGGSADAYVEFEFHVPKSGLYDLNLFYTKAPDFSRFHISLDSQRILDREDAYCWVVKMSERTRMGTHFLTPGVHRLRVIQAGKNSLSSGYSLGLDALEIIPVKRFY